MIRNLSIFAGKLARKAAGIAVTVIASVVFMFLDFLDTFLCIFYRLVDEFMEVNASPCYCEDRGNEGKRANGVGENEVSETLYLRKNIFRDLSILKLGRKRRKHDRKGGSVVIIWSDCGCESCLSWQQNGGQKLHVVASEPLPGTNEDRRVSKPAENVIFLHGFLSSSSLWTESVFRNLSESVKQNYRLFAVDLLGFGRSPKPRDCLYTMKDHLEKIEKSVIYPFQINSFHLVAHSMGCIIALALAAKYPKSVKTITLIAPPYFPSSRETASSNAFNKLAEKKLWPPLMFGASVMSWYEHVGRSVCFLVCRNHKKWEWILRLLSWQRDLHFMVMDLTRHTHHSAWHTMHNVICGGAKLMDEYLEIVSKSGAIVKVYQGDRDMLVPLECSQNIKLKLPLAEVEIISGADHSDLIIGREKDFTRDLEQTWSSFKERDKKEIGSLGLEDGIGPV